MNLSKEDGMDRLIKTMKEVLSEEGEIEAFFKWKDLDTGKKKEGEDVRTLANCFLKQATIAEEQERGGDAQE